jgi:hypothetical protein
MMLPPGRFNWELALIIAGDLAVWVALLWKVA